MSPYQPYLATWLILLAIWAFFLINKRHNILIFQSEYLKFILVKWKLATFITATVILSGISMLEYDPTWDIPETIMMGLLTYYTAPYSIGILYRFAKGWNRDYRELYISIIFLFFSSAWSYDLYAMVVLLGNNYPTTAFANLCISPFFYILAGMMWNLDYREDTGVIFVYNRPEWIAFQGSGGLKKIYVYVLPIVIFMAVIFGYFIYLNA